MVPFPGNCIVRLLADYGPEVNTLRPGTHNSYRAMSATQLPTMVLYF